MPEHQKQENITEDVLLLGWLKEIEGQSPEQLRQQGFRTLLEASVTMRILALTQQGGPTLCDMQAAARQRALISDQPLCAPKPTGETAKQFNTIAQALAVLAFLPGGVELFGMHFQAAFPPAPPEEAEAVSPE